jgi:hypothetical protein
MPSEHNNTRRINYGMYRGTLFAAMLVRLTLITTLTTTSCLIVNPADSVQELPLTPPRIRDIQGRTRPRIGNLIEIRDTDPALVFDVPVDDVGVTNPIQWKLFVNFDRDCIPDENHDCEAGRAGEVAPDGTLQRRVRATLGENLFAVGCNRVELWVSSRFVLNGDRHTPLQPGDVDFASWWVFKRASGSTTIDPIGDCANRVQP